jgi:hypothetical protein
MMYQSLNPHGFNNNHRVRNFFQFRILEGQTTFRIISRRARTTSRGEKMTSISFEITFKITSTTTQLHPGEPNITSRMKASGFKITSLGENNIQGF